MKTEFKTKFLQYLNQRNQEEKGFTLIELLVVIIIIGILSAIALPSFLNQANKAKESEAKQYTGSMNRAQQSKFAEAGTFVTDIDKLGIGIKTQTTNFKYTITATDVTKDVANKATPQVGALRAYTGSVVVGQVSSTSETTTLAVLCVTNATQTTELAGVTTNPPTCAAGSDEVKK
jgi:prepilin-type N-terminal cleavage/methylation domain-containing protein